MKIKEARYIPLIEVKKILERKAKEKELGYEQRNALEFLRKFAKLSEKDATELREELEKIEKLKEKHIVAIMDFLPEEPEELRALLAHEIVSLTDDEKKKILAAVKKFL